jgi:hypothetical protein
MHKLFWKTTIYVKIKDKLPLNEDQILNSALFIALFAEKRSEWRKIY